ncbi:hypothetical protein P7C70_g6531, partial [Phenoliferia sp. Uapishka_3]
MRSPCTLGLRRIALVAASLATQLALAAPAIASDFNATQTWIDGPSELVACQTAIFSWDYRLGSGPYLVSIYDARPTTGSLPVTQYTTGDTSSEWQVSYPEGTVIFVIVEADPPDYVHFPTVGRSVAWEVQGSPDISCIPDSNFSPQGSTNVLAITNPSGLVTCEQASYTWAYTGGGSPKFELYWSNGNGVSNRTLARSSIDEALPGTTLNYYTWLVDYPAGTWIEAILTSQDEAVGSTHLNDSTTHLPGLAVAAGVNTDCIPPEHGFAALADSGTIAGASALTGSTPVVAPSMPSVDRHKALIIGLSVGLSMLALGLAILCFVILRSIKQKKYEAKKLETRGVVGGRDPKASFEMRPGKYATLGE